MKRNRIHLYALWILAAMQLAGCTAGLVEDVVPEAAALIALSFGKPHLGVPVVLTRADAPLPAPTPLPEGATVRIGAYFVGEAGGGALPPAAFATTAPTFEATYVVGSSGALTPCLVDADGKQQDGAAAGLVVRGGVYDFYAVSPARLPAKDANGVYRVAGIPQKEDVMTSFARGVAVAKSSTVTLNTFRRKCALVVFTVAPSPGNGVPFRRLFGTGLLLKKVSAAGGALVAGEETGIPPTGGGVGDDARVEFAAAEFQPVEPGSDPDGMGLNKTKGVLLPKNGEPFEVEIGVQRDDETATLKAVIDRSITFDEGKRYIFTLEVKNNESALVMRVQEWATYSFTDESVGGPDVPYPDPDINEGIGVAVVVARWTEIPWSGNGAVGGNDKIENK